MLKDKHLNYRPSESGSPVRLRSESKRVWKRTGFTVLVFVPIALVLAIATVNGNNKVPTKTAPLRSLCGEWNTLAPSQANFDLASIDFSTVTSTPNGNIWFAGPSRVSGKSSLAFAFWDGSSLTNVPGSSLVGEDPYVFNMKALAENSVWAAGVVTTNQHDRPLVVHWDGSAWQNIDVPEFSSSRPVEPITRNAVSAKSTGINLLSVDGSSDSDLWFVGLDSLETGMRAAILHWNGSTWEKIQVPDIGADRASLSNVVALSSQDVWAFGERDDETLDTWPHSHVLSLHWSGQKWSVSDDPMNESAVHEHLASIIPGGTILVVGEDQNGIWTLIKQPNSNKWKIVNGPVVDARLWSVATVGSGGIWALGEKLHDGSPAQYAPIIHGGIMLHWEGTGWKEVSTSSEPQVPSILKAASDSSGRIWAVVRNRGDEDLDLPNEIEYYVPCPAQSSLQTLPGITSK